MTGSSFCNSIPVLTLMARISHRYVALLAPVALYQLRVELVCFNNVTSALQNCAEILARPLTVDLSEDIEKTVQKEWLLRVSVYS